jgi:carbamoyltransferase
MKQENNRHTGPLALGIHWAHDASVSICSPEGCLFSVAEERITRVKHHYGFPIEGIRLALKSLGLSGSDIDIVAISRCKPLFPAHTNHVSVDIDGGLSGPGLAIHSDWKLGAPKARTAKLTPPKSKAFLEGTAWAGFESRHWSHHQEALADLGLLNLGTRYVYVTHHRAHAASAFRLAGIQDGPVCVVTLDGKGDEVSGTVYLGSPDGKLLLKRATPAEDSLGSFYQAITEALGFVPVDGEYKTMGLAALGKPGLVNPFNDIVMVQDGMTKSRIPWTFRSYNATYPDAKIPNPLSSVAETENFRRYTEQYDPTQVAYFAQEHLEFNILRLMDEALKITGTSNLAVAGGVMLNVKANSRVRDELAPARYFVFPDAADSGLAVGAAMEAFNACGMRSIGSFSSPYLGHSFDDERIRAALDSFGDLDVEAAGDWLPVRVAKELVKGRVIGTFQGRMEAGPRELGNRSVLADPRNPAVKDRINLILKGREWFVPFAPIVLEDEAARYWSGSIDYRHMTFAVTASDYAKSHVPGVVHVDGTMRPQVVNSMTNPWLNSVLEAFRERSGVGVLINTSFNRHGLPIVGSPVDAIDHLRNGWVDCLAIGGYFVQRKRGD